MKLQEILIGNTPKAQTALNAFFDGIDEERILWYPSSASDYRDIVETSAPRQLLFEPPLYDMEAPNIFCHSDYFKKHIRLKNDVLFDDQKTVVRLLEKHSVSIRPEIDFIYKIDPKNAAFIDEAPVKPTIYFLKLKVESVVLGEINVGLFYFLFENYNLLEQVFLKNDIKISHFVKVREGCGLGGNKKSITVFYSLLGELGVKYLYVDNAIEYCKKTHDRITFEHFIDYKDFCGDRQFFEINYDDINLDHFYQHKNFELYYTGIRYYWSGYRVKVFKVIPKEGVMIFDELMGVMQEIIGKKNRLNIY